jgi:hypothetical protein
VRLRGNLTVDVLESRRLDPANLCMSKFARFHLGVAINFLQQSSAEFAGGGEADHAGSFYATDAGDLSEGTIHQGGQCAVFIK